MTNYERIISMTLDEMAIRLSYPDSPEDCPLFINHRCDCKENCDIAVHRWLESEVDDGKDL